MKTPAIIASLTLVGSIAYAAGSQGVAGKQSPAMPSEPQAHSKQEEMAQRTRMQMMQADCPSGVPLSWFSPVPTLVPCVGGSSPGYRPLLTAIGGPVDVNGDGVLEFWGLYSDPNANETIITNGTPTFHSRKIWVNRIDPISRATTPIRDLVTVVPENFGTWLQATFPGTQFAAADLNTNGAPDGDAYLGGFRDMDGDGDFDYVVLIRMDTQDRQVWFENTGYEKPASLIAADLNHDGKVDGADMGLLLYAWGPNQ